MQTLKKQGTEDTVVPFALLTKLQALVPSANSFALEAEGHSVVVENPDKCIECILEITRTDNKMQRKPSQSLKRKPSTRKKRRS